MKIKQKKLSKKTLIIIAVISLLVIGAVGFYASQTYKSQQIPHTHNPQTSEQNPENKVDYSPPTQEQIDETQKQKEEILHNHEHPPAASTISTVINRARQASAGQPLDIRATISGTTSGTCNVKLTKSGSASVEKSFPINFEATSSSCSASIPASEFSTAGEWALSVIVTTNSSTSTPTTQPVTISK